MTEEPKTPETKPEAKPEESSTPVLDEANKLNEEIKKNTEALKVENNRREELLAKQALGGQSVGAFQEGEKEETPKEYKDRVMAGEL